MLDVCRGCKDSGSWPGVPDPKYRVWSAFVQSSQANENNYQVNHARKGPSLKPHTLPRLSGTAESLPSPKATGLLPNHFGTRPPGPACGYFRTLWLIRQRV